MSKTDFDKVDGLKGKSVPDNAGARKITPNNGGADGSHDQTERKLGGARKIVEGHPSELAKEINGRTGGGTKAGKGGK